MGDLISQGAGCILAAPPALAVRAAELVAFWRVDPMQADALACDFEGIAVNYPRWACDLGEGEAR